jgi:hypothetical protein
MSRAGLQQQVRMLLLRRQLLLKLVNVASGQSL